MRKHKPFLLDQWRLAMPSAVFLRQCREAGISVYECVWKEHALTFFAPLLQRRRLQQAFPDAELLRTCGLGGFLLRFFRKPYRIAAILLSIGLWWLLASQIYVIDIEGEDDTVAAKIRQQLKAHGYEVPFYAVDETVLKRDLRKELEHAVAWLEVERLGSRYRITYTPKKTAQYPTTSRKELIAQKDGVIQRYDISHGEKLVAVDTFVHKGDVLVANTLQDSSGKTQELAVAGRVFAYTWQDVEVSLSQKGWRPLQYFELLMEARRQVSADFHKDDRIEQENILQFYTDAGKIKMVVHYTLLQDITTP